MEAEVIVLALAATIVDLMTLAVEGELAKLVAVAAIRVDRHRVVSGGHPFFANFSTLFRSFARVCNTINYPISVDLHCLG